MDPGLGAQPSAYDDPEADVYGLEPERVSAWSYGNVGHWTEKRF